ncbi:MAG TPA: hypothetical protein VF145_00150 [Chitinophagaceae bacterium]
MTYSEFQYLSDNEKADCLWDRGKPVAKCRKDEASENFVLYQLDAFYVEVAYRNDFVEMLSLQAFETSQIPLIYLDQVDISGLQH